MATLQDVAAASGYSVMTASRVLSGNGYASSRASKSVLAAAAELGYVPNGVARSLRQSRTGTFALIISDFENAFYGGIAKTAETMLGEAGIRLFIGSSEENAQKERQLLTSVLEIRAEALLITPAAHNGGLLRDLAGSGLSIVQLDRVVETDKCSSVLLDNEAGGSDVIDYVVAMGHRRVVFISGPRELTTGKERTAGALGAAAACTDKLDLDIIEASSYLHVDAAHSVREALQRGPTAIIAGNNVVAEACMEVFTEFGINVPSDISLVTFDDLPWMRWLSSPLTTIRQPIERMTIAAVELLLESVQSDAPPAPVHLRFPAQLIGRDSVARV